MKDHIDTVIDAILQERKAITKAVKWLSFFTLFTLCGTVLLLAVLVPESDRKDAVVEIAGIFGSGDHFWCVFAIMFHWLPITIIKKHRNLLTFME